MNKNLLLVIILVILLSGCTLAINQADNNSQPPSGVIPPVEEKCGLENCHGLEFTCGSKVPDFCTEIYQLGDFCRQYAICEIINGQCQLVPSEDLENCRTCVHECLGLEAETAFQCESDCREEM